MEHLGLSGVLNEDTLGTLLGGIGGYVLSQGVGRAAAHRAQQNSQAGAAQAPDAQKGFQVRLDAITALKSASGVGDDIKSSVELLITQAQEAHEKQQNESAGSLLDSAQFLLERK